MTIYSMALAEAVVDGWITAKEQRGVTPIGIKLQSNEIKALERLNDGERGPMLSTREDGTRDLLGMAIIQVIVAPLAVEERFVWELTSA